MRKNKRFRLLSLVSVLTILATALAPVQPALAAINWSAKAPMATGTRNLALGVRNGKIYAGGGSGGTLQNFEEFDPAANTWTVRAPRPTARWNLGMGVIGDKLYAVGGYQGTSELATVEEYDFATNTWTTKAPMPTARRDLGIGVVNNKLYAIGGYAGSNYLATVQEYDPATNTWTTKSPKPTQGAPRIGVIDNKIYAVDSRWSAFEVYDPATDSWTSGGPLPGPGLTSDRGVGVAGDKLYTIDAWGIARKYDPVANTWTDETTLTPPIPRAGVAITGLGGRLYAIGGWTSDGLMDRVEEGIVPADQEPAQVGGSVDPAIELTLNPTSLQFGNVNPAVGNYQLARTATVRSNRNWQLFVRKASDLTGANTGWVIPSAQLTFTSPAQANPVQFQNTDTLVDSGGKTAGSNSAVTYNLNITWNDDPDSYTAEHIYTAVQP